MKHLLFLYVILLLCKESLGIYGGCMSYSIMPSSLHGHVKIEISFLNGWKLDKGPCYNCTESDEGQDVTARRKMYIQKNRNPDAFGLWGFESQVNFGRANLTDITTDVNNNVSDMVLMVNSHEQWEMEISTITMEIDLSTSYYNAFDIFVKSKPDDAMTKIPSFITAFLQVKVDANKRSDTGKPNNSPVVLVKPFYSLEYGKSYNLHIPVIDNDNDYIRCFISSFIEGMGFSSLMRELKNANLLSMDRNKCILTLKVTSPIFEMNDTFGIPVTVKDYGKIDISAGTQNHFAYTSVFGHVPVLMFFKVTDITHPPEFIKPTPPNNQKYTIYVGGDFHVNVYAKPTQQDRQITKFTFLRRDGKSVNQTRHVASWDHNVIYISMSWSPVDEDKGHHIVCAYAEDSAGVSTVELHCYRIEVKVNILRPYTEKQGKPYYASLPEPKDIVCQPNSYCRFPVYAATPNPGKGVKTIVSTSESEENITIEYSHVVINGSLPTTVAQVEFIASKTGLRQICLNASDDLAWTVRCLFVTVEIPDPCTSLPCQHKRSCLPFADNSGFQCYCDNIYEGPVCEKVINQCNNGRNPCFNSTCTQFETYPFYMCKHCSHGKHGFNCDIDTDICHPSPCNDSDICHQVRDHFECLQEISSEVCPSGCSKNESTVCVQQKCICALGLHNDGICKTESHLPLNMQDPHFVKPTPVIGSIITCDFQQKKCQFPIYVSSGSMPILSSYIENAISSRYRIDFSAPLKDPSSGVYLIIVSIEKQYVDPFRISNEFDVCLNVAKLSTPLFITDKKCILIVEKAIPEILKGQTQMSRLYPGCSFSSQTLPRETVIGCERGQPCHFFMYAETKSICPNLTTHDRLTGIFTPQLNPGLCRYEVVYTNTSSVGQNALCFKLCSKGETRCYKIHTYENADQCSSSPCMNNGYCQIGITGSIKCHCQTGYWGRFCEKGFCNSSHNCKSDAVCLTNINHTECVCRPESPFSCHLQELNHIFTDATNKGQFTNGIIEILVCYIDGPCSIPFNLYKRRFSMGKVKLGFTDNSLEIQSVVLKQPANGEVIVRGTLTVVGHELGVKKLCLQSVAASRNTRIEDEICFNISVTEGKYTAPQKLFPHFVPSTLPNATVVQCVVKERCYLNMWAENKLGINECPLLETDKSKDDLIIFPLRDTVHQPCHYDVSILRDNVTVLHLCFTLLSGDASAKIYDTDFQDKRCYFIKFVNELTGKGTCAGKFCYNDGFCDGSSSTYKCMCRLGFSGINCSENHGNVHETVLSSNEQVVFGDLALPKSVSCAYETECLVLYSVSNTLGVNTRWNGTNIDVINIGYEKIPSSLDVIGKVVLIHKSTGTNSFCIILSTTTGSSTDVQCSSIVTHSVHPKPFPDYGQTRFLWSSPTNGTVFTCTFGQPCHVLITLAKEYNNVNCPVLMDRTRDGISTHIFVSNFTSNCRYDVWIGSLLSDKRKTKDYCFQSPTFGVLAEIRCFKVYFDQHVQNEATTTINPSSIGSTASTSHSGLMCPKCDADLNCVWNGTCYPGQVCMIRSFNGATVVHCSEKEDCNFIKAAVPHVEILCCEDHQCITNIIQ